MRSTRPAASSLMTCSVALGTRMPEYRAIALTRMGAAATMFKVLTSARGELSVDVKGAHQVDGLAQDVTVAPRQLQKFLTHS